MNRSGRGGEADARCGAGLLLLHGLTGTPAEVLPLSGVLGRRARVSVPLLPGHGTRPEDLRGLRWTDWTHAAEEAFDRLAGRSRPVVVAGLSMGALLALHLGLRRPVAGIVSMAAPIHIRDARYRGLALFRFLQRSTRELTGGLRDPNARHETYPWCPTDSLYEMKRLADDLTPRLGDLRAPLLVLQGRLDSMVDPGNAEFLFERAGSARKRLRFLERSDHALPLDVERRAVIQQVGDFARACTKR